jgi:NADH:ubiquinone oxidoreductase subunit 5 (subunit L)/multisubunit Na+/H+ antiporter MnhA subunit
MAVALVVLAAGSVVAGFIGVPHALGGHNALGEWLAPVVGSHAPGAAQPESVGMPLAGMTIAGDCVVSADASAKQLPGMTLDNCAPAAADVALAANVQGQPGVRAEPRLTSLPTAHDATADRPGLGDSGQTAQVEDEHAKETLEIQLMLFSSAVAALGLVIAWFVWLRRPEIAASAANRFPAVHRLLLNKYYVDELYDLTVVQPVKIVSEDGLWRGMDARVVDGAVNGTGQIVGGMSAVFRLFQTGSVKTYAASMFLGVVLILAYYLWR